MKSYTEFSYLTPPRTDVRLSREALPSYEAKKFWAQIKLNGTRSVIFVPPDRIPFAWNRHGQPQKAWKFTPVTAEIFQRLPGNNWFVFDGELLHNKTKHIKNINYLYDILVNDGVFLIGTIYQHRYDLLQSLWEIQDCRFGYHILNDNTWLAMNFTGGFTELFDSLTEIEEEGIVVKNPNGMYYGSHANSWMAKILRQK